MNDSSSTLITAEDVRAAVERLGGPNHTNAGKIREVIGRGSLATIQKHLQALRDAQSKPDARRQLSCPIVLPSASPFPGLQFRLLR